MTAPGVYKLTYATLPAEILRSIFAQLPLAPRLRAVSLVCRKWRQQVLLTEAALEFRHDSPTCGRLWSTGDSTPISCNSLYRSACALLSNLHTLTLEACPDTRQRLPTTLRHLDLSLLHDNPPVYSPPLPALHSLRFMGSDALCLTSLLRASVTSLTRLELVLTESGQSQATLIGKFLASTHFPHLQHLSATLSRKFEAPLFAAFMRTHATQLLSLRFSDVLNYGSAVIAPLLTSKYPHLTRLTLVGRSPLEQLDACLGNCRSLTSLDLTVPSPNLPPRVASAVTSLICPFSVTSALQLCHNCPRLRTVCLPFQGTDVNSADAQQLQPALDTGIAHLIASVRIERCSAPWLHDFLLHATRLVKLALYRPESLADFADIPLPSLEGLTLRYLRLAATDVLDGVPDMIRWFLRNAPQLVSVHVCSKTLLGDHTIRQLVEFLPEIERKCVVLRVEAPDNKAFKQARRKRYCRLGWSTRNLVCPSVSGVDDA